MMKHWTQESTGDFAYSISLDFFSQLQDRFEQSPMMQQDYAAEMGVSPSRVSQVFNDPPSNPKVESLVKYARALGMKVAIVAYDDGDPDDDKGPVYSEIFTKAWQNAGKPRDLAFGELATVLSFRDYAPRKPMGTATAANHGELRLGVPIA